MNRAERWLVVLHDPQVDDWRIGSVSSSVSRGGLAAPRRHKFSYLLDTSESSMRFINYSENVYVTHAKTTLPRRTLPSKKEDQSRKL